MEVTKSNFFTKINKKYGIQFFLNKKLVFEIIEFENSSNIRSFIFNLRLNIFEYIKLKKKKKEN